MRHRRNIRLKTWSLMYGLIWLSFIQILIVMFPVLPAFTTFDLHMVVGLVILVWTYTIYKQVRETDCPNRIKMITRTTFSLGVFMGVLGVVLYVMLYYAWSGLPVDFINFLHVVTAIAIITQASSSATAFDMWEEKEFMPAAAAAPSTTTV